MNLRRNSPAVVLYANPVIGVDRDVYGSTIPSERFVYRIIDNFKDEMVKSSLCGISDVHPWSFPYRFESFKNFDLTRSVVLLEHVVLRSKIIKLLFFLNNLLSEDIIFFLLSKQ